MNLGLAVAVQTGLDVDRSEFAVALRHDNDAALAGLYDSLGGHQQYVFVRSWREADGGEHARDELTIRIGELNAYFDRARRGVYFGQDRAHLAFEYRAGHGRRSGLHGIARAHLRRRDLGHLGVHPDSGQAVDAKQRCARHHRHALARGELTNHARDRCGNGEPCLYLPACLDRGDLSVAHTGEAHPLPGSIGESGETLRI